MKNFLIVTAFAAAALGSGVAGSLMDKWLSPEKERYDPSKPQVDVAKNTLTTHHNLPPHSFFGASTTLYCDTGVYWYESSGHRQNDFSATTDPNKKEEARRLCKKHGLKVGF